MKKLPAQPVQGLMDGLTVLQELAVAKEPLSCKNVSEKLGIELTRVNRLLKTLDYLDIAHQTQNRKYRMGPGIHVLAVQSMLGSGLIAKSLPVLERLKVHGYVVALGVLWRDTVSYLYHASPEMSNSQAIARIGLYPATESSIGMILLSQKSRDGIIDLFPEKRDLSTFLKKLEIIKRNGHSAIKTSENVLSIAVKLGQPAYAGIAISGNIKRTQVKNIVAILKDASKTIEGT